jgi:hypothetical protein
MTLSWFPSASMATSSSALTRSELAAGIVADYGGEHDRAVACFKDGFEACIAVSSGDV